MMTTKYDTYTSPLAERNASPAMLQLWSPRHKFNTWRRIWLAVAEAQHELGLDSSPGRSALRADSSFTPTPPTAPNDNSENAKAPLEEPTYQEPTHRELVTKEQVEELRAVVQRGITDDEIRLAEKYERELRHDVMAHVHALGDSCPKAKRIIHLGMTSQDVVCNADLVIIDDARTTIYEKIQRVIFSLSDFARQFKDVATLGFTHYQPAQPLTVGRRAAQWAHDLYLCDERIRTGWPTEHLRGLRGATGTQASFLHLMSDHDSVDRLESRWYRKMTGAMSWGVGAEAEPNDLVPAKGTTTTLNFDARKRMFALTTQTYPRVIDTFILADLASTAAVLHKIATDIRLLCNRKELDEPFETNQIGSSAMPYKRNPMRCERICGLSRFVMNLLGNAYDTAATQWLERTLDDSSNRRLSLPEAFLALDGALDLMHNVASGLIVHEAMVRKNLMAELPFLATENILMACVKLGGDRQHYHELIRVHAQAASLRVKDEGLDNDLLDRLQADKNFQSTTRGGPLREELDWHGVMDPMKYIGRSIEQTERFIKQVIEPLREQYGEAIAKLANSEPKV